MQDIAITNAMVAFLVAVAHNVLPNATADVAIPDDFKVLLLTTDLISFGKHQLTNHCLLIALDIFLDPAAIIQR